MTKRKSDEDYYKIGYQWMCEGNAFIEQKLEAIGEAGKARVLEATPRVVNIKSTPASEYVYIGRPSLLGNPYAITATRSRDKVIEMYRKHISEQIHHDDFIQALIGLIGKNLGCYCKPAACHGDVLAELVRARCIAEEYENLSTGHLNKTIVEAQ